MAEDPRGPAGEAESPQREEEGHRKGEIQSHVVVHLGSEINTRLLSIAHIFFFFYGLLSKSYRERVNELNLYVY